MFYQTKLHLARSKNFPEGSSSRGYEILAPLDSTGRLDPSAWREAREFCRVRRFWSGEPDRTGQLIHRAGGAGGATWLVDYDDRSFDDDEAGYQLGDHAFAPGEYISIKDEDGHLHTFVVAGLEAVKIGHAAERA